LLQRILNLNGVNHCWWKSPTREQFGNIWSDGDMYMSIDEARQQCPAAKVDTFDLGWHLQWARAHGFDGLAFHQHISPTHCGLTAAINKQGISEQSGCGHTHLLYERSYTGHQAPVSAMSQNRYS